MSWHPERKAALRLRLYLMNRFRYRIYQECRPKHELVINIIDLVSPILCQLLFDRQQIIHGIFKLYTQFTESPVQLFKLVDITIQFEFILL